MEKTVCNKCHETFYYEVTDMHVPGGKDREEIRCPYCGAENGSVITSGFVYSYKEKDKKN